MLGCQMIYFITAWCGEEMKHSSCLVVSWVNVTASSFSCPEYLRPHSLVSADPHRCVRSVSNLLQVV